MGADLQRILTEKHPFSFKIDADLLRPSRFRWTVCEGDLVHLRSPHSYATRREAEDEAKKALAKRADNWSGPLGSQD
jgi:hypothetical protein